MAGKPVTRANLDPTIPWGSFVTIGSPNVRAGGYGVALAPSPLTPHGPIPGHGELPSFINVGSTTVRANGRSIIRQGDVASCGDSATGYALVRVGG